MYLAMKSVFLETFGCQMNELDSELVRGHLESLGYTFTTDPKSAEILLYNTCSVREHAEARPTAGSALLEPASDPESNWFWA
jgi:tRNA-2-methylthio-N6-dimethylallyladenosine synthase